MRLLAGTGFVDLPPIVSRELLRDGRLVEVISQSYFRIFKSIWAQRVNPAACARVQGIRDANGWRLCQTSGQFIRAVYFPTIMMHR